MNRIYSLPNEIQKNQILIAQCQHEFLMKTRKICFKIFDKNLVFSAVGGLISEKIHIK